MGRKHSQPDYFLINFTEPRTAEPSPAEQAADCSQSEPAPRPPEGELELEDMVQMEDFGFET